MRHRKKFNHLGRTASHRKAMLSNMACSLIEHKRINTTLAKAKALRGYIEPLMTKSKTDSTHSRRMVFRKLKNKYAVSELFREVAPKIASRWGGYTRIIRTTNRLGDNAEMCLIELVDFNETYKSETKKKVTRRSRRGKKRDRVSDTETSPEMETTSTAQTPPTPNAETNSEEEATSAAETAPTPDAETSPAKEAPPVADQTAGTEESSTKEDTSAKESDS